MSANENKYTYRQSKNKERNSLAENFKSSVIENFEN